MKSEFKLGSITQSSKQHCGKSNCTCENCNCGSTCACKDCK